MTTFDPPRPATIALDSWAGRYRVSVHVIGETPKRYRVRWLEHANIPARRTVAPGDVTLVPKHAVRFDTPEEEPTPMPDFAASTDRYRDALQAIVDFVPPQGYTAIEAHQAVRHIAAAALAGVKVNAADPLHIFDTPAGRGEE